MIEMLKQHYDPRDQMLKLLNCLTILVLFTSCASMMKSMQAKPSGKTDPSRLSNEVNPNLSFREWKKDVSRSVSWSNLSYTFVEFMPVLPNFHYLSAQDTIKNTGFKENWSEERKKKEIDEAKKDIENSRATCFLVRIETKYNDATNHMYWHGSISQGKNNYPLKFFKFEGFVSKKTTYYASSGVVNESVYRTYNVFGMACIKAQIDLSKQGFTIDLSPRYQKELETRKLYWNIKPEKRRRTR
jgi:hypothetical protein